MITEDYEYFGKSNCMKKGLLIWKSPKSYKNIGDYIQSLAAEQYTGSDVVYIEREKTHL